MCTVAGVSAPAGFGVIPPRRWYPCDMDTTLPADYEVCGTCGFDHAYDSDYPGVREKIEEAHEEADDVCA